jgi:hypothetical protein
MGIPTAIQGHWPPNQACLLYAGLALNSGRIPIGPYQISDTDSILFWTRSLQLLLCHVVPGRQDQVTQRRKRMTEEADLLDGRAGHQRHLS